MIVCIYFTSDIKQNQMLKNETKNVYCLEVVNCCRFIMLALRVSICCDRVKVKLFTIELFIKLYIEVCYLVIYSGKKDKHFLRYGITGQ